MAKLLRERAGMGAMNLLAPRRLGADAVGGTDSETATGGGAVPDILRDLGAGSGNGGGGFVPEAAPAETLILGMFTPVQVLLGVAAAWFLFKK